MVSPRHKRGLLPRPRNNPSASSVLATFAACYSRFRQVRSTQSNQMYFNKTNARKNRFLTCSNILVANDAHWPLLDGKGTISMSSVCTWGHLYSGVERPGQRNSWGERLVDSLHDRLIIRQQTTERPGATMFANPNSRSDYKSRNRKGKTGLPQANAPNQRRHTSQSLGRLKRESILRSICPRRVSLRTGIVPERWDSCTIYSKLPLVENTSKVWTYFEYPSLAYTFGRREYYILYNTLHISRHRG